VELGEAGTPSGSLSMVAIFGGICDVDGAKQHRNDQKPFHKSELGDMCNGRGDAKA
jgi:hypothetical protein